MYPYYIVPDVEKYQQLDPHSEEAQKLSRRIAANIGDYAALRLVLGIDPPEFARFYPDMDTHTPTTFDTINSFLDKFGTELPATGYVAEEKGKDPDLSTLLKEKRYREALKLIEGQNLNNTEKSIYFAHQIRFLKKLIAIENYKNQTNGLERL